MIKNFAMSAEPLPLLSEPSGNYGIGFKTYFLIDPSRKDPYLTTFSKENKNGYRELVVRVYYPSSEPKHLSRVDSPFITYWEKFLKDEIELGLVRRQQLEEFNNLQSWSRLEAPIDDERPFPVIIFFPGYDSGPYAYTAICEGLASFGYIVCFVSPPGAISLVTLPDGRNVFLKANPGDQVIETCTKDAHFVINWVKSLNLEDDLLKNSIKLEKLFLVGHSLGGMVSHNICRFSDTVKAGISIDASLNPSVLELTISSNIYDPFQRIDRPFLHILAGNHNQLYDPSLKFNLEKNNQKFFVIEDTQHNSFSDYCLYPYLFPWLLKTGQDFDIGTANGPELIPNLVEVIKNFLENSSEFD